MKIKKFLKLIAVSLCIPISLYYSFEYMDIYIDEKYENVLFGKNNNLEYKKYEVKLLQNKEYLLENGFTNINLKIRNNYSLTKYLNNRDIYYAYVKNNIKYINLPVSKIFDDISVVKDLKQNLLKQSDGKKYFINYVSENKDKEILFNIFLNGNENLFVDVLFFHEFSHTILNSETDNYLNNIIHTNEEKLSMEETFCDIMAILLTINKNDLNQEESIELLNKMISFRFSSKIIIKNLEDKETTHDTVYGLYKLLNDIKSDELFFEYKYLDINNKIKLSSNYSVINYNEKKENNILLENEILDLSKKSSYIYKLK